jgi:hypothetical protein
MNCRLQSPCFKTAPPHITSQPLMSGAGVIARASAGGVILAFIACHALNTPFFHVEDPQIRTKAATGAVNAVIMSAAFELAFETGLARHNMQLSTKTQMLVHYAIIEGAYWTYHTAQHAFAFIWSTTGHGVHHSVGKETEMSPLDAWFMHPFDFLGWSACAILPNVFQATRLHASQHTRLLTIMATVLMLQHTPAWTMCTESGWCAGHPLHHADGGKTSLLLGL